MKGKKRTPQEFNKLARNLLGEDYIILNEYQGSNSYIQLYHKKCNNFIKIRANHLLAGQKCECTYINPFAKDEIKMKIKQTMIRKYGVTHPLKSINIKEKMKATNLKKYGVENVYQSKEIRSKIVKIQKNSESLIDGTKFDSSYERDVYDFCLRNNITVEDRQIPLKYNFNGKDHVTFIDFKIDSYLFECKGPHLLNGVFDYIHNIPIEAKLEVYRNNNVIIITDDEVSDKFLKSDRFNFPLIGIDINLFRDNLYKLNGSSLWNIIKDNIKNSKPFTSLYDFKMQ